jgi:hypothetical protein
MQVRKKKITRFTQPCRQSKSLENNKMKRRKKTLFFLVVLLVFGYEAQAQECGITHSSNVVTQETSQQKLRLK